jgi:hypothetical protein
LAAGFVAQGCSNTEPGPSSHSDATRAELFGTVLDRATGVPVSGARVTLPGGRDARSDEQGRFRFDDLEPGLAGEVVAKADDGREGRVSLRPLRPGPLEVVLIGRPVVAPRGANVAACPAPPPGRPRPMKGRSGPRMARFPAPTAPELPDPPAGAGLPGALPAGRGAAFALVQTPKNAADQRGTSRTETAAEVTVAVPASRPGAGSWRATRPSSSRPARRPSARALLAAGAISPERRAAALMALGCSSSEGDRPRLEALARTGEGIQRLAAILALGEMNAGATSLLLEIASQPDALARECALLALLRDGRNTGRRRVEEIAYDASHPSAGRGARPPGVHVRPGHGGAVGAPARCSCDCDGKRRASSGSSRARPGRCSRSRS